MTAKQFYVQVERSCTFSLLVLQAGLLIALYEVGHGIYPAAFLSVGACARYAQALGIKSNGSMSAKRVLSLVEVEEHRRVWWAIVILDRFVSIGCPGRPFATEEPSLDELLPSCDTKWDRGLLNTKDNFKLSSPMSGHMSKFALLCQAARLLGLVLSHLSTKPSPDDTSWIQLDRTLQSILAAALELPSPDYDQITFIYSALIALHVPSLDLAATTEAGRERVQRAKAVMNETTERIYTNLIEQQCFLGRDPEDLSPWGLFFAYRLGALHSKTQREDAKSAIMVKGLKEGLALIDARWHLAGKSAFRPRLSRY